jgi:hypothetical protein
MRAKWIVIGCLVLLGFAGLTGCVNAPQSIIDDVNGVRAGCTVELTRIAQRYPNPATMPAEVQEYRDTFQQNRDLLAPVKAWMLRVDANSQAVR